jgi:hypothetical protein
MSQDFMKKNDATFERIVSETTQGETIGENIQAMKDALKQAMGHPSAAAPSDSVPATTEWEFSREVRWHESTGRRPLILRAHTQADLDALERQVLYGNQ